MVETQELQLQAPSLDEISRYAKLEGFYDRLKEFATHTAAKPAPWHNGQDTFHYGRLARVGDKFEIWYADQSALVCPKGEGNSYWVAPGSIHVAAIIKEGINGSAKSVCREIYSFDFINKYETFREYELTFVKMVQQKDLKVDADYGSELLELESRLS